MKVAALHIWVADRKTSKTRRIIVKPQSQDIDEMKLAIAKVIKKLARKIKYYYVVVCVRRPGGKYGYRTVIGKRLVE